jgi:glycosyltransferase involved in cell wall biosynthesis
MRIGVNTRLFLKGKLEGIGWFMHETLKRMVLDHPEHEFFFFFDRPFDEEFIFADNVKPVVIAPQARHPILFYIWFEWAIPKALKKHKIDVFLSPDNYASLRTNVPTCLVVHDLAFEHYPKFVSKVNLFHYKKFVPKFIAKAKTIIAVSTFTKEDIVKQYGTDPRKIEVIYNGAHQSFQPLTYEQKLAVKEKYTNGREFFLFTGSLHPRKNVINLLKAFVKFKRRLKSPMKLVIVGRMAWLAKEIEEAKAKMPFKDEVIWLGYVPLAELTQITGAAYAMVYPSLFEGFGIPILESLKTEVPVIASNTSSMPEVLGAAGILVNPLEVEEIANAMERLYKDENLRHKLVIQAKLQGAKFSWDRSAEELYKAVMNCI